MPDTESHTGSETSDRTLRLQLLSTDGFEQHPEWFPPGMLEAFLKEEKNVRQSFERLKDTLQTVDDMISSVKSVYRTHSRIKMGNKIVDSLNKDSFDKVNQRVKAEVEKAIQTYNSTPCPNIDTSAPLLAYVNERYIQVSADMQDTIAEDQEMPDIVDDHQGDPHMSLPRPIKDLDGFWGRLHTECIDYRKALCEIQESVISAEENAGISLLPRTSRCTTYCADYQEDLDVEFGSERIFFIKAYLREGKWPGVNTCEDTRVTTECGEADSTGSKANEQIIHHCIQRTRLGDEGAQVLRQAGASLRLFVESSTAHSYKTGRVLPRSRSRRRVRSTRDSEESDEPKDDTSQSEQDTEAELAAIEAGLEEQKQLARSTYGSSFKLSSLPRHKSRFVSSKQVEEKIQTELPTLPIARSCQRYKGRVGTDHESARDI